MRCILTVRFLNILKNNLEIWYSWKIYA